MSPWLSILEISLSINISRYLPMRLYWRNGLTFPKLAKSTRRCIVMVTICRKTKIDYFFSFWTSLKCQYPLLARCFVRAWRIPFWVVVMVTVEVLMCVWTQTRKLTPCMALSVGGLDSVMPRWFSPYLPEWQDSELGSNSTLIWMEEVCNNYKIILFF